MKVFPSGMRLAVLLAHLLLMPAAWAQLKPFPLTAGQRGTVTCLESPSINYDIYLPPAYATNGTPRPILYTLNPSGGGMVTDFQTVCSSLNIIVVGVKSSKNGAAWNAVLRDFYAVPRDVRQRVLFDPSAVLVSGFSGGGENTYVFSRFWSQQVAGLFAMSGWLGCTYAYTTNGLPVYYTVSQVLSNLAVARSTGTSDAYTQTNFLGPDGNFLLSCGAKLKDWTFSGGHAIPPDSLKTTALTWLLTNRVVAGPNDQSNALVQAALWRSRVAGGQSETVLRECVGTLMNQPRTWFALEAQLVMDDLMTNYDSFRSLSVTNLATGDFAGGLFYYYARGAATNGDWQRYNCALKALTGITGTSGERAGDICYLLNKFNYPSPRLQMSTSPALGLANLWVDEDVPALDYSVQTRSDLFSDWQDITLSLLATQETNAVWSAVSAWDPASGSGFYRVATLPSAGVSPPWPNGTGGQ